MKKNVELICDVDVKGSKKCKPFIKEVVDKFTESIEYYYKLGFVKSISLDIYFKEKDVENE